MKKLLFLLCLLLTSCSSVCLLSQVPPQTIQAGPGCQAPIPDYTKIVKASGNCNGPIKQVPAPGTILTINNPSITVVLTVKNVSGVESDPVNISVTLIDTVKPILSWPVGQANMTEQDLVNLYANWEAAVKVQGIAKWMYDRRWTQGMAFADTAYIENQLHYFTNVIKLTDEEYAQYVSYIEGNH